MSIVEADDLSRRQIKKEFEADGLENGGRVRILSIAVSRQLFIVFVVALVFFEWCLTPLEHL